MIAYITVPEPCHEDWQQMAPADKGRHCAKCCKTVIDFSGWEPQEILYYLKARQSENICGRFRKDQLNTPILTPETFVRQLSQTPLSVLKKIAAIFLFAFGLMNASCNQPQAKSGAGTEQTPLPDSTDPMSMGGKRVIVAPVNNPPSLPVCPPPIIVNDHDNYVKGGIQEPYEPELVDGKPVLNRDHTGEPTADGAHAVQNVQDTTHTIIGEMTAPSGAPPTSDL